MFFSKNNYFLFQKQLKPFLFFYFFIGRLQLVGELRSVATSILFVKYVFKGLVLGYDRHSIRSYRFSWPECMWNCIARFPIIQLNWGSKTFGETFVPFCAFEICHFAGFNRLKITISQKRVVIILHRNTDQLSTAIYGIDLVFKRKTFAHRSLVLVLSWWGFSVFSLASFVFRDRFKTLIRVFNPVCRENFANFIHNCFSKKIMDQTSFVIGFGASGFIRKWNNKNCHQTRDRCRFWSTSLNARILFPNKLQRRSAPRLFLFRLELNNIICPFCWIPK